MLREFCDICQKQIKDSKNDSPECLRFGDRGCLGLLDYTLPDRGICRCCHDKIVKFIESITVEVSP
jgi:hypothetical protein